MATLSLRVAGPAAPAEVWQRYYDTRRWPDWSPQIRTVRTDGGPFIEPGLTGQVVSAVGLAVRFEVIEVDETARTWHWRVRFGPVRLSLAHAVSADAAGSLTRLTITGPLPVIASYAPIARWALGRLVAEPA